LYLCVHLFPIEERRYALLIGRFVTGIGSSIFFLNFFLRFFRLFRSTIKLKKIFFKKKKIFLR